MSTISAPPPIPSPELTEPPLHRWTIEEYQQISDSGLLLDQRTELLDGYITDMLAQNYPHVVCVSKTNRRLVEIFDEEHFWLTVQSTVRLDTYNAPEPDFAVMAGKAVPNGNRVLHPLLVIEVSDWTLLRDRTVKGSLYAAHQIPDYWVINLEERQVEVYRQPVEDKTRRFGWRYSPPRIYGPTDFVSPLAKPDAKIEVARMLP